MFHRVASIGLIMGAAAILPAEEVVPRAEPVAEPLDGPAVAVPAGGNQPQPEREPKALSRSGMFRVAGGEGAQRSSVALQLEQCKDEFHTTLEEKERGFVVPVDVMLSGESGDAPQLSLKATEDSFVLGIRIHLERGVDHDLLERAAMTVLLYERSLRGVRPADTKDPLVIRPWLVEGLLEAAKWRSGRADRRLYEGVFRRGGGFTLDEVFELPERNFQQLDGPSRLAFRALSGALVMALLEQPEGRGSFRSFCGEVARFPGEMPVLLRKYFPDLNLSERSLAKWWALTLAKLVQPELSEVLPITETERELKEALQFHSRDDAGNAVNEGIESWRQVAVMEGAERVEAVRPAEDGLNRLSYRCFPSYRPLLREYQQVLRDLVAGDDDEIQERLAVMAEERRVRLERALRARDYMDYFEISRARTLSGEFDDYLRLKKELELRPRPLRTDRASSTLDTIQKAFEIRRKR